MAQHLVSIYGTEQDKVNCPFYYKIGACRHGDRCSRVHNKPLFSQTILLTNLYTSPDQIVASARAQGLPDPDIPEEEREHHFDDFYDDVRQEMERYGRVESVNVCENLSEHLAGNTYVKFADENAAGAALRKIVGRWYAGRLVHAEFSPVTDFREGKCRPFEKTGVCERGDYCHFMHLRRHPGNRHFSSGPRDERDDRNDRSRHDDRGKYGHRYRRDDRERDSRDYGYRYDRDRDRHYDRDRGSRNRDRERDRSRDRDRRRDYDRERPDFKRGKGADHEMDTGRDRDRDRDRDRRRDSGRDIRDERRRDRDGDRGRDHDRGGYKDYDRGDDRGSYRERRGDKRNRYED